MSFLILSALFIAWILVDYLFSPNEMKDKAPLIAATAILVSAFMATLMMMKSIKNVNRIEGLKNKKDKDMSFIHLSTILMSTERFIYFIYRFIDYIKQERELPYVQKGLIANFDTLKNDKEILYLLGYRNSIAFLMSIEAIIVGFEDLKVKNDNKTVLKLIEFVDDLSDEINTVNSYVGMNPFDFKYRKEMDFSRFNS